MPRGDTQIELKRLAGKPVETVDGKVLGEIDELVADARDGRIEYVTLRLRAGKSNAGGRVAIPWSQFRLASGGNHLELDISPSVLQAVAARRSQDA
ncbi:MAG: PRC-barrel domain-containing protein [Xanthomonadales bacterium]|nr:PRC-barrel domain-containing protein [Xanthomonadales bacterium]